MINYRPDRLGHSLYLTPEMMSALEAEPIPIECCPTSNVMTLELTTPNMPFAGSLKSHPWLKRWLEGSYPISISTDDMGVFETDSVSELLLVAEAFDLDEFMIAGLVWGSVDHVFESNRRVRARLARDVLVATKKLLRVVENREESIARKAT